MRVISGSLRGKKILEPKDLHTRPLKDLTKESIFNIITHTNKFKITLKNSIILDLFAGVGSFGLECLSRGVKEVFFVENYIGVLPILEKNLLNFKSINNYKIIKKDIYKDDIFKNLENKIDIIFLDPPYKDKNINKIFEKINISKILRKNSIIIIHRHKKEADTFPPNFKIMEEKNYGISKIIFLSKSN
tara:strand:- start:372 stop:938 length:567 start_codon:yes stop_codon:yes gene_type:complete